MEVLSSGQVLVEMIGRGEQTDPGAQLRKAAGEGYTVEPNRSRRRRDQAAEQLQQGCFAGAVGSQERDTFPGCKIQMEISERPQKTVGLG